ncbi:hypothetical protein TrCOL_g323 [Triparma columacea]|uniref:Thioredoxin domain-containing protein n=1 Tax=Triparma columacea TaxID=722753 RepID=A0A9W7GIB8_9STRA|nr:hypothetical protein TrCOL_g323 [Triparma columacea]
MENGILVESGDEDMESPQQPKLAPLQSGHFNVTSKKRMRKLVKQPGGMLVGFSAPASSCSICAAFESSYMDVYSWMLEPKAASPRITFVRVDAHLSPTLLELVASLSPRPPTHPPLPSLYYVHNRRSYFYDDAHTSGRIIQYLEKVTEAKPRSLTTVDEAKEILEIPLKEGGKVNRVVLIGVFTNLDVQDDELDDFLSYFKAHCRFSTRVYCAVVEGEGEVVDWLKSEGWFDRGPAAVLFRSKTDVVLGGSREDIVVETEQFLIDESRDDDLTLQTWVDKNSLPVLSFLTPSTFTILAGLRKPMVMLFLDYKSPTSGGVPNAALIKEMYKVAREMHGKLSFVVADGAEHLDRMSLVGVENGMGGLPAVVINGNTGRTFVFDEDLPMNEETIIAFCSSFLTDTLGSTKGGRGHSSAIVKSAAGRNKKNSLKRGGEEEKIEETRGVKESMGKDSDKEFFMTELTPSNFEKLAMDDSKDVVIMLYKETGCEGCMSLAVFYKRVALRFAELGLGSKVVVTRLDLGSNEWGGGGKLTKPEFLPGVELGKLPVVMILPAGRKNTTPYLYYTGIGKVLPMMKWVEENSGTEFELEELAHLNDEEKVRYKEQIVVRERERKRRAGEEL